MTDDEFINALVAAKKPEDVFAAMQQLADASDLAAKADRMEAYRQRREGLVPMTPMDSGTFFQNLLKQGGGKPIPLK